MADWHAVVLRVQRMAVARLRVAPDERLVAGLQEEDLRLDVPPVEGAQGCAERERRVALADVEHDGDAVVALGVVGDELREVTQQRAGHVVHDRVAEVLEDLAGGRLAGAREARDDRHVLAAGSARGRQQLSHRRSPCWHPMPARRGGAATAARW